MSWLPKFFSRPSKPGSSQPTSKTDLDGLTLQQLEKAGGNLSKPTEVVNYLYIRAENDAQKAAQELRAFGYRVEVKPAATGSNWLALATKEMLPSRQNIDEQRRRFEALAGRFGGDYDGWEAAVTS